MTPAHPVSTVDFASAFGMELHNVLDTLGFLLPIAVVLALLAPILFDRFMDARLRPRLLADALAGAQADLDRLHAATIAIGAYHGDGSAQPRLAMEDDFARHLGDLRLRLAAWRTLPRGPERTSLAADLDRDIASLAGDLREVAARAGSVPHDLPTIELTERARLVDWIAGTHAHLPVRVSPTRDSR